MAEILRKAAYGYNFVFNELADPRTKSWLLVAKPYEGAIILVLYLMFVLKWGPEWMKNRQPFNVDRLMIAYNILQIFSCGYVFIYGLKEAWLWKYKLFCEPVDYSYNEDALKICNVIYVYYLLKILDLVDTIFFVLRKKFKQISFLHVYHHTGMVMLIWGGVTYLPGGHATMIGLINSFVHMVMYTYYLLTIAVPRVKQSLWFKKYVTQIQILQFFLCVVHMGSITFMPDCAYPRWTVAVFLPQNLFMLILFLDFYIKTYIKKPKNDIIAKKHKENGKCIDDSNIEGVVQKFIGYNDNASSTLKKVNRS